MDKDGEIIQDRLQKLITFLGTRTPDGRKTETQLRKFADMNDNRCFKLMKIVMDPNSDIKTIIKSNVFPIDRLKF